MYIKNYFLCEMGFFHTHSPLDVNHCGWSLFKHNLNYKNQILANHNLSIFYAHNEIRLKCKCLIVMNLTDGDSFEISLRCPGVKRIVMRFTGRAAELEFDCRCPMNSDE